MKVLLQLILYKGQLIDESLNLSGIEISGMVFLSRNRGKNLNFSTPTGIIYHTSVL
jgi:hypothetical protein